MTSPSHTCTPLLCPTVRTGALPVGRTRKQLLSFTNVLLWGIFSLGFLLNSLKFIAPECCLQETCNAFAKKNHLPLKMPVLQHGQVALRMVRSHDLPSAMAFAFRGIRAEGSGKLVEHRDLIEMHPWPLHAWLPVRNVPELSRQHVYRK